ncbi:uncharacterized protein LOC128202847 [Mya arenaria]|uniref:uncharacterized protein LOC128202847 n=1 Tax=Mya arenaria TaxID=6604 RepID=UPI0022E0DB1C|nr:uncharacterized protein LOC128202847 [Mya arenaria]XP_052759965.1 uncharacterized protein LOC128202847 [Mya arenaria]XP_052759966.1 uncharacterized protein LOC128202847 [Mya arenaria]
MSCFNCCVELTECEDSTKYKRPNQLSNNLQNRKWSPESGKPNISIMQALEDICDGEVSLAKLKIHSSRVVCHECQVYLRQAINKKCEVDRSMKQLISITDKVSNEQRSQYYTSDVFTDKPGQCWSCFCQFKEGDNKKKRMNMSTELVDGLNVMEGIESLLGEKADSLFGLYPRAVYICKDCFNLLRHVIKSQCVFESYLTTFNSQTNENSTFSKLCRGEILDTNDDSVVIEDSALLIAEKIDEQAPANDDSQTTDKGGVDEVEIENDGSQEDLLRQDCHTQDIYVSDRLDDHSKHTTEVEGHEGDQSVEYHVHGDSETTDVIHMARAILTSKSSSGETHSGEQKVLENERHSSVSLDAVQMNVVDYQPDSHHSSILKNPSDIECIQTMEYLNKIEEQQSNDSEVDQIVSNSGDFKRTGSRKVRIVVDFQKKQIGTVQSEDDNMPANKRQKMDSNLMERDPDNDWVLYRDPGDFKSVIIQMIFAEAGVAYQEMALEAYSAVIGTPEEFPNPSCSVLRRGTLKLSATPVICKYLAQQFDLYPANVHAQLQAEQICSNCHDFITEAELHQHLPSNNLQQESLSLFQTVRLPPWLKYFEHLVSAGNSVCRYLFDDKLSYADLVLYHAIRYAERFPAVNNTAGCVQKLRLFKREIDSRPCAATFPHT